MRYWKIGIVVCLLVAGCREKKEGVSFSHKKHSEAGVECTDCHEGAMREMTAGMPKAEFCFECHSALDEKLTLEKLKEWYSLEKWKRIHRQERRGYLDLKFSHETHKEKEIPCSECHGKVESTERITQANRPIQAKCLECHQQWKGTAKCSSCHEEVRFDRKPSDHITGKFIKEHGLKLKEVGWSGEEGEHYVCARCHSKTKPRTHLVGWGNPQNRHCCSCHLSEGPSACNVCHRGEIKRHSQFLPSDHTRNWTGRQNRHCDKCHFPVADEDCGVCHRVSRGEHSSFEPVNHAGSWSSPANRHCRKCHFPLDTTDCAVCHQKARHKSAPDRPMDSIHKKNAQCTRCHSMKGGFPHYDPGESCVRCHKL